MKLNDLLSTLLQDILTYSPLSTKKEGLGHLTPNQHGNYSIHVYAKGGT